MEKPRAALTAARSTKDDGKELQMRVLIRANDGDEFVDVWRSG